MKITFIFICISIKSFRLILPFHFLISSISFLISLVLVSFGKIIFTDFMSFLFSSACKTIKASACFITWSSFVICFSNALPSGEYVNLAWSIILLWSEGNISLPVRYSYLSILLDDYVYIFYASRLMLHCNFSCLILSSVVIINFYIISKRFFLRREELSDKRLVSITKKRIWFWSILFIKIHEVLKVNIWWMINCNLLKFSFVWNFHNKIVCWI